MKRRLHSKEFGNTSAHKGVCAVRSGDIRLNRENLDRRAGDSMSTHATYKHSYVWKCPKCEKHCQVDEYKEPAMNDPGYMEVSCDCGDVSKIVLSTNVSGVLSDNLTLLDYDYIET